MAITEVSKTFIQGSNPCSPAKSFLRVSPLHCHSLIRTVMYKPTAKSSLPRVAVF